jgi:hypothetical protein
VTLPPPRRPSQLATPTRGGDRDYRADVHAPVEQRRRVSADSPSDARGCPRGALIRAAEAATCELRNAAEALAMSLEADVGLPGRQSGRRLRR